jgi:hypothetical protein
LISLVLGYFISLLIGGLLYRRGAGIGMVYLLGFLGGPVVVAGAWALWVLLR